MPAARRGQLPAVDSPPRREAAAAYRPPVHLTVTVTGPNGPADLRITAPDDAAAREVLAAIREQAGLPADAPLRCGGHPVESDRLVGDCGLLDGGIITAAGKGEEPAQFALVLTSGEDAGRRLALRAAVQDIGRDPACEIRLAATTVSRHHARIDLSAASPTVTDLGSANGTEVDGKPIAPLSPATAEIGATLRLGECEVRLDAPRTPAAGPTVIHRGPRLASVPPAAAIQFPAAPTLPQRARVPLLGAALPLLAGGVLAVALHQWQFVAFTALSPLMLLGQVVSDRRGARREHAAAERAYRDGCRRAAAALRDALATERRQLIAAAPDIATVLGWAQAHDRALWQRGEDDPDWLRLRVGRGDLPSAVEVRGRCGRSPAAVDVPLAVRLGEARVLGVAGPAGLTAGLLRAIVLQAATLHGPDALRLVVISPSAEQWAWVRWLPHVAGRRGEPYGARVGFSEAQITDRLAELSASGAENSTPTLVVVDGGASPCRAELFRWLRTLPDAGVVVWSADHAAELPSNCGAVAEVHAGDPPTVELQLGGAAAQRGSVDLVARDVAEAAARALAPLRPAVEWGEAALPSSVSWSETCDVDLTTTARATNALIAEWRRPAGTLLALGIDRSGVLTVDLERDGPHALVAGTTGAGKSELLISLVASLAAANPPDQLALLLVDHKGGAAFGRCAALPHVVGVVTDLDAAATERALVSLGAEVRRRETALASAGASDFGVYRRLAGRGGLPRLVVVVDEFAALVEALPDATKRLAGIAQRGRSLGMHLVLATQRPEGVVSADIRANTRLRICLGVAREQESRDVIDGPQAAHISRGTPGRALLRIGPGELRLFQAARIGGVRSRPPGVMVEPAPAAALGDRRVEPDHPGDQTDLDVFVDACVTAGRQLGAAAARSPWLPPLPRRLPLRALPTASQAGAPWALADLPDETEQRPLLIDLRVGATTVIAGGARSGRTTAAVAYATAAAAARSPLKLWMWAIDGSHGLRELAALPHCGGVVPGAELDRVEALIGFLDSELAERRRGRAATQALLLVVDGWEALAAAESRSADSIDRVTRLASAGPSVNLHLVVTGDRGVLSGRLAASAGEKLVLRLADPADYLLVGVSPHNVPRMPGPGRALRAADHSVVQIAEPDGETVGRARAWPPAADLPRFEPLPACVRLRDVGAAGGLRLGVGADARPVALGTRDLVAPLLIAGPRGSGRSTALLLVGMQLHGMAVAVHCAPTSPLAALRGAVHLPRDDQDHAAAILAALAAGERFAILADDVDLLADGPLAERLAQFAGAAPRDGRVLGFSATADAAAGAFRGPLVAARQSGRGVLLCPRGRDGDVFGVRLRRQDELLPGRGWLVRGGAAQPLQLALPDVQASTELELAELGRRRRE